MIPRRGPRRCGNRSSIGGASTLSFCRIQWENYPHIKVQRLDNSKGYALFIVLNCTIPLRIPKIKEKVVDGVLMVVIAAVYWHPVRDLIDSGATRCFVSSRAVQLGLQTVKEYTFLELRKGQEILSKGKTVAVPIVTADITVCMDFTVTAVLHDIDLIFGINRL